MKLINKKSLASLLVIGALAAGNASAMSGSHTTQLAPLLGVSSVNLIVTVEEGVATLFGDVDSGAEATLAANYVAKMDNVDKVINLISIN